jgi:nitroreductase
METGTAIIGRRSIRKFGNKPVPNTIVDELLKAAMHAPSARNLRPWQFIVVNKRKILDELSDLHPYAKMMKEATLAILVCGDLAIEKEIGYLAVNCSAATQNILLTAYDQGLGSVWLGVYPREARMIDLKEYFDLPGHIVPISLIAIGWPAEDKPRPERFEKEKVHYSGW